MRSAGATISIRQEYPAAAEKSVGRKDSSCGPFQIERHRSTFGKKWIVLHADHLVLCDAKSQLAERPPVEVSAPTNHDFFHGAHARNILNGRLQFRTFKR